jgi:hypothetical protein
MHHTESQSLHSHEQTHPVASAGKDNGCLHAEALQAEALRAAMTGLCPNVLWPAVAECPRCLQMLGMSFFFYEVQRAGPLPPSTRAPWRADSLKSPSGGNLDGEQFQGGYFDAGDHNKFQLPTAFTTARLNWLLHAFPGALQGTFFDVRFAELCPCC